jgi:nitrate reductase delta subunit
MKTFKVFAALLSYPEAGLIEAVPELASVLDEEKLLRGKERRALDSLLAELRAGDLMGLQERYVGLFDRVRTLSLHLFEHVHGESRDRGQAMVELNALYARHGFRLEGNELPDFLPAFLEFLSYRPLAEATELLSDTAHILEAIAARLKKRGSAYGTIFEALTTLAGQAGRTQSIVSDEEIRAEDDPATLDKVWQEAPAFGPGSQDNACGPQKAGYAVMQFHRRAGT